MRLSFLIGELDDKAYDSGGFPPPGSKIFGGVVRSRNLLMRLIFLRILLLFLLTLQVSIPAPICLNGLFCHYRERSFCNVFIYQTSKCLPDFSFRWIK